MLRKTLFGLAAGASVLLCAPAQAQDRYLGQILLVGYDFCPVSTATADGSLVLIADNRPLFAVLGNSYGGDGITDFALPDLRGRVPVSAGVTPLRSEYPLGQAGGAATVQLTAANLPPHSHAAFMVAAPGAPNSDSPANAAFGSVEAGDVNYVSGESPSALMMPGGVVMDASTGGDQPFPILSPYVAMRYCIVTRGISPP